jgi:alcohol dehydrogenase
MDLAYRITRRGGETVSAGLSHPTHDFALKHVTLVAEERTIKGSYVGSCVPVRDVPRFVAAYRSGQLPVDRVMGEHIGLEELNGAFDRLAAGNTVRQILIP